jgi:hypothetical protein
MSPNNEAISNADPSANPILVSVVFAKDSTSAALSPNATLTLLSDSSKSDAILNDAPPINANGAVTPKVNDDPIA